MSDVVSVTIERTGVVPQPVPQPVICLHRGTSVISRLIKKQQRSVFSHASILFPDNTHYESREFRGVLKHPRFTLTNKSEAVDQFVYADPLTAEEVARMRAFLDDQVGKPYDWWMVFGFVSRSDHEGPSSDGRYFCSELVAHAGAAAGDRRRLLLRIDHWAFSPMHIAYSPLIRPVQAGDVLTIPSK